MSELNKITSDHLRRHAVVYVRQSSSTQVEHNRESTAARLAGLRHQRTELLGFNGEGCSKPSGAIAA